MSIPLLWRWTIRQLRQITFRKRVTRDMHVHRNIRDRRRMPACYQVTERQRHAKDRPLTKIKVTWRGIRRCDEFTVDPGEHACADDFTNAHGRASRHRPRDLKRDVQRNGLLYPLGDMHRQRIGRHDIPTDARQQHDVICSRVSAQPLSQPVNIDLGSDVQIVDAGLDARAHQGLGRVRKGSGEVEQYRDARQPNLGVRIAIEYPIRHIQVRSE